MKTGDKIRLSGKEKFKFLTDGKEYGVAKVFDNGDIFVLNDIGLPELLTPEYYELVTERQARVIVKRGPAGHWYANKVGQSFNVLGYDDSYEAYLVEVPGYAGRFIYRQDCYYVSTTFDADFTLSPKITDSVVDDVIQMFKERSETGIRKYGTTLDRTDLDLKQWIQHAIEEQADNILYLKRILREL